VNDSRRARTSSWGSGGTWLHQLPNKTLALLVLSFVAPVRAASDTGASGAPCDATRPQPVSYPLEAVDARPVLARSPRPLVVPPALIMAGVTGDVHLEFVVGTTGAVDPCSIRVRSSPRPEFATSAKAFVRGLRFSPGLKNGVPVRTHLEQTIHFRQRNGDRGKHHIF